MAGFWDKEKVIRDVWKTANEDNFYRVNVVEKDGKRGIDLRSFYTKKDGSVQHTKSGLLIAEADVEEVITWLQEALVTLEGGDAFE